MIVWRTWPLVALCMSVAAAGKATAQSPRAIVVRLRVVDSSAVAVPGADASLVQGVNRVLARGTTDEMGRRQLTIMEPDGEYEVVVRKVGYQRTDLFFSTVGRDTLSIELAMSRAPQPLDSVRVTAQSDIRERAYHVDADQIGNSERPIVDAWDVIEKMRPDMVWGLGGKADRIGKRLTARPIYYGEPPPLQQVFVNGHRVFGVPIAPEVRGRARSGVTQPLSLQVKTILASIHPEHIAEMSYVPARENTMPLNQSSNAVFIVLKPGVSFEPVRGSFTEEAPPLPLREQTEASVDAAHYRARLLGVFDELSGRPIENAAVIDTVSGLRMFTSATGTVSLIYLPDGGSTLRIQKSGYEPKLFCVAISVRDTLPVTVTMVKSK